jgi:hypothetical protein
MEIVYVVSDGQIIQSPTAIICQAESERSIFVPSTLNQHSLPLKFQRYL